MTSPMLYIEDLFSPARDGFLKASLLGTFEFSTRRPPDHGHIRKFPIPQGPSSKRARSHASRSGLPNVHEKATPEVTKFNPNGWKIKPIWSL